MGEDIVDYIFENSVTPLEDAAQPPTITDTPNVEDKITAILEQLVSPKIASCSNIYRDKEKDLTLEILDEYFSKYQEEKLDASPK
jgi:hypothetical protein